jgi:magnesium-transporting ATPase (P-type)
MRLAVKVAKRFAEPLIAILLVAAAISGFTGDMASFAIIVVVIVLSIALDVVQEQRAEQAADALRRSVAIHADALRDEKLVAVPVEQLVPGDVVALRAGDLVPADGVIVASRNLHVNEALMTGEPYPVEKRAAARCGRAIFRADCRRPMRRSAAGTAGPGDRSTSVELHVRPLPMWSRSHDLLAAILTTGLALDQGKNARLWPAGGTPRHAPGLYPGALRRRLRTVH